MTECEIVYRGKKHNSTLKGELSRMRSIAPILLLCAVALFATNLIAQDTDAEGCNDSPVITRMPGSSIHSCDNKEYEQAEMPTGKDADGNVVTKTFEGEYHYWDYGTREGVSEIQVFRNFETALKQAGFSIVFEQQIGRR